MIKRDLVKGATRVLGTLHRLHQAPERKAVESTLWWNCNLVALTTSLLLRARGISSQLCEGSAVFIKDLPGAAPETHHIGYHSWLLAEHIGWVDLSLDLGEAKSIPYWSGAQVCFLWGGFHSNQQWIPLKITSDRSLLQLRERKAPAITGLGYGYLARTQRVLADPDAIAQILVYGYLPDADRSPELTIKALAYLDLLWDNKVASLAALTAPQAWEVINRVDAATADAFAAKIL